MCNYTCCILYILLEIINKNEKIIKKILFWIKNYQDILMRAAGAHVQDRESGKTVWDQLQGALIQDQ